MEPMTPLCESVICKSHFAAGSMKEYPVGSMIAAIRNRANAKLYFMLYQPKPVKNFA